MKSSANTAKNKKKDLTFVPLNIQDPFKFDTSNFEPLLSFDDVSISNFCTNIFIGFPPLNLELNKPFVGEPLKLLSSPLMPYPTNVPSLDESNLSSLNSNIGKLNQPEKLPKLPNTNTAQSIIETNLEYPSEVDSNDLYSYNKPRLNEDYDFNLVNPLDILRQFDLYDEDILESYRGSPLSNDVNEIYMQIEKNNALLLATMKSYRIPYPIAKLLIKKVIKLTLDYSKK